MNSYNYQKHCPENWWAATIVRDCSEDGQILTLLEHEITPRSFHVGENKTFWTAF
jgi:hypothetical protein